MDIKFTIDRFEEDKAVLKTEDNKTVVWPKSKLPSGASESSVLYIKITTDEDDETNKQAQVKDILNEILDINE